MIRPIVRYGDPVLRQKGTKVESLTTDVKALIEDLIETMHAAHGIGLAVQQIGQSVQVTVVDVRGLDRPSSLEIAGRCVRTDDFMPMVLINPEITLLGESVRGLEGCLSFPEIFADIDRPELTHVSALDKQGEPVQFRCGGLLARAIQHEVDHLNGILFIDRMDAGTKRMLKPQLAELQARTKEGLRKARGSLSNREG